MHVEGAQLGSTAADRIELILHRLDSLPTLGTVAVRLLELTADVNADVGEVIRLVSSDPALSSKVLAMCRCHERGRAGNVTTIERAVLLLGFEAVRCVVLSVRVFEVLDAIGSPTGEVRGTDPVFDREAFWLHTLAVAVASERIAARSAIARGSGLGEAFMAGLLHDMGTLVLHVLLPATFDQVCRVAETHGASLDHACRRIIGIDTHTAGKRLAENWGLPRPLVDVIWLCGQSHEALPNVPHRSLISVVSLADAVVRSRYVNPGAHGLLNESISAFCVPIGITPDDADALLRDLHEEVGDRAAALGMSASHDPAILLRSICRANESLARANEGMRQRDEVARRQARILEAIVEFRDAGAERASVLDVLGAIARSATRVLETPVIAAVYQVPGDGSLRLVRFSDGRPADAQVVEPPPSAIPFHSLACDVRVAAPVAALMPWIGAHLSEGTDLGRLRLLPLAGEKEAAAVLIVREEGEPLDGIDQTDALFRCWRAALVAGIEHERAGTLAEQLADANRTLLDTQEALARSRTMGTLGEVAAGAAHEMNNPLTVISGRAQLLAHRLTDGEHRTMAGEIFAQAHRLSDMITALRSFAEPIEPDVREIDLPNLVVRVVQKQHSAQGRQLQINTVFADSLPPIFADPDLLAAALSELVTNAVEAKGSRHIDLRVQTEPPDGRLKIEVRDDGDGLSEHALRHAFDPFFSDRPAGRQPGLGLARARRFVEAHGGRITLVNAPAGGAVATIWLDARRRDDHEDRRAA